MSTLTADLLLLVVAILDTSHEDGRLIGEDHTTGVEVPVTGVQDSVQHALVEQEIPHPFGDDDVDFGEGHLDLLHLALEKGDLIGHSIDCNNLASLFDDRRHVNTDDVLRTRLHSEPGASISTQAQNY